MRFIHPEILNEFNFQRRFISHNHPELTATEINNMAYEQVKEDCMTATLQLCPQLDSQRFDILEREIGLQETLDEYDVDWGEDE
jgi:hypothetical protein